MEKQLVPKSVGFDALGVGNTTGYRLIKEKKLTLIKIGAKSLLDPEEIKSLKERLVAEARAKEAA